MVFSSKPQRHATDCVLEPNQIVCLEDGDTSLYAEVVQLAEGRNICWVRPLVLIIGQLPLIDTAASVEWYDLRNGSDLLCPIELLRVALDTEAIPALSYLSPPELDQKGDRSAHQQLHQFIRRLWQTHPEAFQ